MFSSKQSKSKLQKITKDQISTLTLPTAIKNKQRETGYSNGPGLFLNSSHPYRTYPRLQELLSIAHYLCSVSVWLGECAIMQVKPKHKDRMLQISTTVSPGLKSLRKKVFRHMILWLIIAQLFFFFCLHSAAEF